MTNKEAISYINRDLHGVYASENYFKAHYMAIEALEKQIPRKPLDHVQLTPTEFTFICPNCENATSLFHGFRSKYCPKCGQAIDWSDM